MCRICGELVFRVFTVLIGVVVKLNQTIVELVFECRPRFFIQNHFIGIRTVNNAIVESGSRQIFDFWSRSCIIIIDQKSYLAGTIPIVVESAMGKFIIPAISTSQSGQSSAVDDQIFPVDLGGLGQNSIIGRVVNLGIFNRNGCPVVVLNQ